MALTVVGVDQRLVNAEALLVLWLDRLTTAATKAQATSLSGALLNKTQAEWSELEGVSQPTVNKKLRAAGWHDVQVILQYIENSRNRL